MSGRTLHWRDSVLITNRKTDRRRAPRTAAHLGPDWELSFELPTHIGFAMSVGPYPGLISVKIGIHGHVEIRGKNKQWVLEQTVAFLKKIAPEGLIRPLNVRLIRRSEPGPTVSGPLRHGEDRVLQITWDGRSADLVSRSASYPITTAGHNGASGRHNAARSSRFA